MRSITGEASAARANTSADREENLDRKATDGSTPTEHPADQELGRGRSGIVYQSYDATGRPVARKVFASAGLTKAVQYVFLGAPNPYLWNASAVRTAVLRRRILAELVEFWFGERLRVARAHDCCWNSDSRALEMSCELINGRHVALSHSYSPLHNSELRDVTRQIMQPLQRHLTAAGFDGLVWQAGRGNPVALNNFMIEASEQDRERRWVWIDLESGVPALIPINPLDLALFYLPKCLRHGRVLFDDVDVEKLRAYVIRHRVELVAKLDQERVLRLESDIRALERNQREWKTLARFRRGITYQKARGSIDPQEAEWYSRHPFYWYARESLRAARLAGRAVAPCLRRVANAIANIPLRSTWFVCWSAMRSQRFRERLAKDFVSARILCWQRRRQLTDEQAASLRNHLESEESSAYLADFGVHVALKPAVKLTQYVVMPALLCVGIINTTMLGAVLVLGGCLVRTLYTLGRLIQNTIRAREKPWTALITGLAPVIGNVAFPMQIIASGTRKQALLARFVLYDAFSRLGTWFPIWGGPDTLTEHWMNHCPDTLFRPIQAAQLRESTQSSAYRPTEDSVSNRMRHPEPHSPL